ncbi:MULTISPECIES: capsule biosynthesis protein [unclassified Xanthobacter]|uniref:capsule biosynthesis protein n=1 Tax=unclassified Xanthobacter TaxID=2623496 RepID=UPI001F2450C4|nr:MULTISPECIES: capsular biosynthesis protein [unclassified Xanthobacter]
MRGLEPASQPVTSDDRLAPGQDAHGRVVLMLQGAASQFHWGLACALESRGARILKVHLCAAEWVFWPGKAVSYRGRPRNWRQFVSRLMRENGVTDLVLFGDCRFYHAEAIVVARALGIRRHLFEDGYLRPHWITLEHEGVNAFSDFPRDPQVLLAEAALLGPAPKARIFHDRFALRAVWDVAWNSNLLLGALAYPHYRRHTMPHPVLEYAGWLRQFARERAITKRDSATRKALKDSHAPYYILPLQLDGDFQIRVHSDFRDMTEATELVFASFARAAPAHARLLVKRHPFDVPLRDRGRQIEKLAARHGFADRLVFVESGDIVPLIATSSGTLVINSTSATFALNQGVPLKVLGRATYDIPGLAFQGSLDDFWTKAEPPDPELWAAYKRVLLERTQINGRFFCDDGIAAAIAGATRRILSTPAPAPADSPR